ncbi:MAG: HAMP domain-containing histidine kinase [Coriobacteriales bacterium]|nr:HAMP domain-containing histidine kinase [Coriobacteriales bacterium]
MRQLRGPGRPKRPSRYTNHPDPAASHPQPSGPLRRVAAVLSVVAAFAASYILAYFVTQRLFSLIGFHQPLAVFLLTVLLGYVVFFVGFALLHAARNTMSAERIDPYEQVLEAIDRMAQGDFNVVIDTWDNAWHDDLAGAINRMARELGSMEGLRQEFISNVSHEIQSPLTSIAGYAALLKDDALAPEQRQRYLAVIEAESRRLSNLSDNLLKLSSLESREDPLAPTPYPLDKQLESIALMLEPQWAAKHIDLEARLDHVTFTGDEALLSQLWINLLHNAIKFTPPNGAITLTLSQREAVDKTDTPTPQTVFTITDTGIGIALEDQPHIFERFYKVDKARDRTLGGNGLGLSLAKKIVELHGGYFEVESAPGKGTAFTVVLPN